MRYMRWAVAVLASVAGVYVADAAYYFSAAAGDDARTVAQAANPSTPWKTTAKANTLTLHAGDSLLFKRGEVFRGYLTIRQSGSAGAPIVVGA